MNWSRFDVAVTGIGMLTPAGIGVNTSWANILAGKSLAAPDPALAGLPVDFSCRVPGFDAETVLGPKLAWKTDRYTQLAMAAAREAVADAGLDPSTWDGARVGVVIGNALGGTPTFEAQHNVFRDEGPDEVSPLTIPMMMTSMAAGYVAMDLSATGPNLVTVTACASGGTAIGIARELLRCGKCDVVLAGGSEASVTPLIASTFAQMKALSRRTEEPDRASRPFDADRNGFVLGEGSAMLVLERTADARARSAPVRAHLSGFGASADAFHATKPDPAGVGVQQAIEMALADAGLCPDEIDHVNAHGTSTQLNDAAEASMLRRVLGERPAVTSVKGVTGHSLGGAGAIEAACTVLSVQHGVVPPTANLEHQGPDIDIDVVAGAPREMPIANAISNSFGFGGQNAVLVVTAAAAT